MKYLLSLTGILLFALTIQAQQPVDRNQVMEYMQEQQYDKIISYLQPVAGSDDTRNLSLLAYAYHQSGRLRDAAQTYERILLLDSNAAGALQQLANIQMLQNQYYKALANYKRLLQLRPDNAVVWRQLSSAAYGLGQADSGFAWLYKSYRLNPADEKVVTKLAEQYMEQKRYAAADSMIRAYLQTDSLNIPVLQLAVKTAYLLKHYERTVNTGEQLRALQLLSPATFSYVTAAAYQLKRYKDCIAIYEYLEQNKISSENITYYAALAYTELKEFRKSNTLLRDCITLAKSDMLETYYHCSSQNYESLKQYKPALACLDSSYYLSREILRLYSMGRIYETSLNNTTSANKYYKRFLQLYRPGSPDEKAIYDYLKDRLRKTGP